MLKEDDVVIIFCDSATAELLREKDQNVGDSLCVTEVMEPGQVVVTRKQDFLDWLVEEKTGEPRMMPMKPYKNVVEYPYRPNLTTYQCGRCKRRLRTANTRDKYCPSCGQRVRWDE